MTVSSTNNIDEDHLIMSMHEEIKNAACYHQIIDHRPRGYCMDISAVSEIAFYHVKMIEVHAAVKQVNLSPSTLAKTIR